MKQGTTSRAMTVGQVADLFGVTVRTLHHYDEIGLLQPSERTAAGYRLYVEADVTRLQHVVVYRRLGFTLEEVADLLADPASVVDHLRRQRAAVASRIVELGALVTAIDRALEREMSDQPATAEDLKDLFGEAFHDGQAEAESRWGETDAWQESQRRTARYTKADWEQVKAESDAIHEAFFAAIDAEEPATSTVAMDAAELHRQHIHQRFYECSPQMHRNLGELYTSDPRFTASYDELRPGMAFYVRDAINANADRQEGTGAPS